ncbi:MAG: polymer-forming cytoskeletal protein [Parvularculaceae bacterium]|nr:polymer-forming cytoskeletal protein [Parvularculaceae bacterium]
MFSKAKTKEGAADERMSRSLAVEASSSSKEQAPPPSKQRTSSVRASGVPTIISADMAIRGNVNSAGEVQLDGTLDGDIKAHMLIVGEKAAVKGEIICEQVMIRGRVEGGIRAKQVALASTAYIVGDILHSSLSVESGAHFEGNCRHSDDPLSEAAGSDFRKTRPTSGPTPRPIAAAVPAGDGERAAPLDSPSFLTPARSPLR